VNIKLENEYERQTGRQTRPNALPRRIFRRWTLSMEQSSTIAPAYRHGVPHTAENISGYFFKKAFDCIANTV